MKKGAALVALGKEEEEEGRHRQTSTEKKSESLEKGKGG